VFLYAVTDEAVGSLSSLFDGGLLTYFTILLISLLTMAVVAIVTLLCRHRRLRRTITGFHCIYSHVTVIIQYYVEVVNNLTLFIQLNSHNIATRMTERID